MYPVTQDFIDKMKADRRQVLARVEVDYTDPFIDQSLEIEANEQANVSYPQQTADSVDQTTRKYACLDGTWDLTSGEYHLAPSADMLSRYQMGWWGAQFCDQNGYFTQPYPTLTVRHLPRPIRQFKVIGDSARGEYPVDFTIRLYAQDGTLLKTESITGNTQIIWQKDLEPQVLDVAKQELIITRWSRPGTCAKIIEFFTSIREVYETGDLMSIQLLEEREANQGSLPVGNISANEIRLALNNESKKFDLDNENSPLKNLLKPNRRIQAWLGAEAENAAAENPPTFTRNSVAYLSVGTQVAANVPRLETIDGRMGLLVEEGTTNIITNPSFESGISGTGTYSPNGTSVRSQDNTGLVGTKSLKIETVADTSFVAAWLPAINVVAGNTYTFSCYTKEYPYANKNIYLELSWRRTDNSVITLTDGTRISASSNWKRLHVTGTAPTEAVKVYCYIYIVGTITAGDTQWIDAAQLEQKPYATSFIDGTRAAESLTIPTAGVLNPQEGTVECWVYVNGVVRRDIIGNWPTVVLIRKGTSVANWIWLYHNDPAGNWALQIRKEDGTITGYGRFSDSLTPDGWQYFAIRWNAQAGTADLFHNGVKRVSLTGVAFPAEYDRIEIGHRSDGAFDWLNSLIDDLRISNRARTDAEIAAAYQSGQPLERDAYTTYLLSFNGSIYPVEQCWVPLGTFWSLDWDSPDDSLEATVTARDRMELLRKGTYQTSQILTNKSLYELAEGVLQDAGLSSNEYVIDTTLNNIRVPYAWFNPVSHREALRLIAEAGLAAAFQNRDGKIQIESFLITGDGSVLEITEDDYFPPLRAPSRQDQVANEIIVDTQPLRPASAVEEVYRSNEPITIPASTTKTITAFYNKTPVIEATASLDNPPVGVSITEATYYGWGASVKIQNTNATDKQATLVIQGKPLTVQNKERAIARDEASILENGVLRFEFPANPLVQTISQAQAIADTLLASVKEQRRDIEVEWRGNPALLLGDRVTVKGKDYHVIRQEIDWQGYLQARLRGRKA